MFVRLKTSQIMMHQLLQKLELCGCFGIARAPYPAATYAADTPNEVRGERYPVPFMVGMHAAIVSYAPLCSRQWAFTLALTLPIATHASRPAFWAIRQFRCHANQAAQGEWLT